MKGRSIYLVFTEPRIIEHDPNHYLPWIVSKVSSCEVGEIYVNRTLNPRQTFDFQKSYDLKKIPMIICETQFSLDLEKFLNPKSPFQINVSAATLEKLTSIEHLFVASQHVISSLLSKFSILHSTKISTQISGSSINFFLETTSTEIFYSIGLLSQNSMTTIKTDIESTLTKLEEHSKKKATIQLVAMPSKFHLQFTITRIDSSE